MSKFTPMTRLISFAISFVFVAMISLRVVDKASQMV
jgi:hypothetical protein